VWEGKPQKDSKPDLKLSNLPITLAGCNPWRWDNMRTWVQRSQVLLLESSRGNACTRPSSVSSHFHPRRKVWTFVEDCCASR
jgi:hypothetical protein